MKNFRKRIQNIIAFLEGSNWEKETSKDGKIIRLKKYGKELSDPVYVFFSTSHVDENECISQINQAEDTIMQFYGMAYSELKNRNEALNTFSDRGLAQANDKLITKVPDKYVAFDTIDLSIASSTFKYLQAIIKDAAITEAKADGGAPSSYAREGREFMKSCRFGHTFRGSFGFQVECPIVDDYAQFDLFKQATPMGRRVSERFIKGLNYLTESLLLDSSSPMTSSADGFTYSMCNSTIVYLEETSMLDIFMSVEFDAHNPTELKIALPSVFLSQNMLPILKEAADYLKEDSEAEEKSIIGRIIALKSNSIPLKFDDPARREITISWDDSGVRRKVTTELNHEDFLKAIHAYEVGDYVKVLGTLDYRKNKVTDLKSFQVV